MARYTTQNQQKTIELGRSVAVEFAGLKSPSTARVFALEGELGSGKTVFCEGIRAGVGGCKAYHKPHIPYCERI